MEREGCSHYSSHSSHSSPAPECSTWPCHNMFSFYLWPVEVISILGHRASGVLRGNGSRAMPMLATAPPRLNVHPKCSDLDCTIPCWEVLVISWVLCLPSLSPLKSSSCSWLAYLENKTMMTNWKVSIAVVMLFCLSWELMPCSPLSANFCTCPLYSVLCTSFTLSSMFVTWTKSCII